MTTVASITGRASPTLEGKRRIALSMYVKGKAFVGAYVLLRQKGDSEPVDYVALQNLCQGIEVSLKGLLLLRDYDRFKGRLRSLGHNLSAIASESLASYGLKPISPAVSLELQALSNLYAHHLLRYGNVHDILVDPRTIPRERVFRRLGAAIRLVERALKHGAVI